MEWRARAPGADLTGRVLWVTVSQLTRAVLIMLACLPTLSPLSAQATDTRREATPQRPSFTADASVTAPGTLELELGGSANRDSLGLPTTLKFTPNVPKGPFYKTEFSLSFESLSSMLTDSRRAFQFGDRLIFAVRRALHRGERFSFALAPHATFFVRGEKGARLGATAIGVWSFGLNTVVANLTYTGATSPSQSNSAHRADIALGYSRTIGEGELSNRFAVFGEYQHEIPNSGTTTASLMQGVAFRARPDIVLDFAVQQSGVGSRSVEVHLLGGLTVNLGGFRQR